MLRLPWEKKPGFWTGWFVILGIGLRIFHYARNPSMWHDEAALVLNAIGKSFNELLGPLFFSEGAPPLFLWIERAVFLILGEGTYALRLVPFLASCAALVLMALIARRLLAPEAAPWAVLPLACADTILWHACEAKPYSVDLLSATMLLAIYCYTPTWSLGRRLALYTVLAPFVIFLSYPGCFLLGGLLVALLPAVWHAARRGQVTWPEGFTSPANSCPPLGTAPRRLAIWLGYGLLIFSVFGSFVFLLAGPGHAQRCEPMLQCWVDLFAPWDKPWKVPIWAILSTFEIFRYCCPPGGQPFALLAVVGGVYFARRGQWRLLALLLVPLLLALFAACVRAYPYGGARVLVYSVPALLLLIAAGTPIALAWLRARSRLGVLALIVMLLVPAGSAVQHVIIPWGRADCAAAAEYVLAHRRPDDRVIGNTWECLYYFRHIGNSYVPVENASFPVPGRVWVLISGGTAQERQRLKQTYAALQGRIIEQRQFERIALSLLEQDDSPGVSAEHALSAPASPINPTR